MRSVIGQFVVLVGLLLASYPLHAAEPADSIRGTINSQLDAFQRDDWAEAFTYASPVLQKIFGTPDRFRNMVLGGYRAVYRPQQVTFRELDTSGPRPVQIVFFIGPDGLAYLAAYEMEQQQDGSWRISAVQLIRDAAKAV
ncbi:DUF4864 domain-containing protein [Nisaea acidiphila]|uniref:DUF4864 domain-containing protein n=1 Tax=Nisaea acidiphila TaxID=1862145 RepID=A0A9J7AY49_9PROT|nr:DUF4864 domain-containing protein [Nisaea acidiphila]UUX51998.1 DUF4864 domain-containing protein [Nisaea acidiphila]